ncbi:MAG: Rrf2 family protein [Halioglobus sp.]|jgi:Rrf2 family iron-sulfur cluster assembly transcriptional regulator
MLHIAHKSQIKERLGVKDIAKAIDSPEAFTGKIMQLLSKSDLVQSIKGPNGGFGINDEDRNKINLRQIVEVLDGDQIYVGCGLGLGQCNKNAPCPMHNQYATVRKALIKIHTEASLEELATKLDGIATLK